MMASGGSWHIPLCSASAVRRHPRPLQRTSLASLLDWCPIYITESRMQRALIRTGMTFALLLTVALAPVVPTAAQAPPPTIRRPSITLEAAQALIEAAEVKAREIGVPMVIVVVDESGILKAFGRMDGAILLSVGIA